MFDVTTAQTMTVGKIKRDYMDGAPFVVAEVDWLGYTVTFNNRLGVWATEDFPTGEWMTATHAVAAKLDAAVEKRL